MSRNNYNTPKKAPNLQYTRDGLNRLTLTKSKYKPMAESRRGGESAENPKSQDFIEGQDPLADVVLVVEGYRFHVNKVILATHSPVFRAMFSQDFLEKNKSEIPFPAKAAFPFYMMLGCLYQKEWFNIKGIPNAQDLLELAREYNIDVLKRECQKFLLEKSTPSIETLLVAQEFELGEMLQRCTESIGENFSLQQLQQHPRYKEIQDKHLVAILTKQISTTSRNIEQNNRSMTEWKNEVLDDCWNMLGYVPDDDGWSKLPDDQSYYFDHLHSEYQPGCKKCSSIISRYIRKKSHCIISKVEKMPKTNMI